MKKTLTAISLIAALGLGATAANAASISSIIPKNERNLWSDNSGEDQNVDENQDGFLGVGDTIRGILEIETIEGSSGSTTTIGEGTSNNELSGIFETEVIALSVTDDPDGSCGAAADCSTGALSGDETVDYVFGPNAAFNAEFGLGGSALAVLFEDDTPDFTRLDTDATPESTAIDGSQALVAGFGDADDFWQALGAPSDISVFTTFGPGQQFGEFNLGVSILSTSLFADWDQVTNIIALGRTGLTGGDGLVDISGNGGILGSDGFSTTFSAFNDVNFELAPIPEPETALLFGFSLLGLGVAARRRRKA